MERRRFLAATGAVTAVGVAGCLGGDDSTDGEGPDDGDGSADDGDSDDGDGNGGGGSDDGGDDPTDGGDGSDDGGDDPADSVGASFTVAPESAKIGDSVEFDATDADGDIVEYRWDFTGDGEFDVVTADPVVERAFAAGGTHAVTLEVATDDGETRTVTESVTVDGRDGEELLVGFVWTPESPSADEQVTFDAVIPEAEDVDIVEYRWDFTGDGETDETTTEPTITHTFDEGGSTEVRLEVTDEDGRTGSWSEHVPVALPITAAFDWEPKAADEGEDVTLDASASESDAGAIVEYRWDFTGDGMPNETTTDPTITHAFDEEGDNPVILEVEDEHGNTDQVAADVWISEDDIRVELETGPEDPDVGDSVTFDANTSLPVDQYEWDFTGDGETDETTTDPTVTHSFDREGFYLVEVHVEGPDGVGSVTETVRVGDPVGLQAAFDWEPPEPDPGEQITLDATDSTGRIDEYTWDLTGDGEIDETTTDPTITHTYGEEDFYQVSLLIENFDGRSDWVTREIVVGDPERLVAALQVLPVEPDIGEEITADASESSGNIVEYRWFFVDLDDPPDEVEPDETTTEPTVTHAFDEPGNYAVAVEVEDESGDVDFTEISVAVSE